MNETINSIKNRRSTRVFLPEQIKEEELQIIIDAGLSAPSAHNQQTWHFAVIQNKEILDQLSNAAKEVGKNVDDAFIQQLANNEKFHAFYNAPTVVIISGDKNGFMPEVDCAAATQNMHIAAESLGLGSCWVGYISYLLGSEKGEDYKKQLGIPATHQPYYATAIGYKKSSRSNAPTKRENTVSYIK
ncbi:nitroreductase [Clostridium zeae]|uniref:Nitroreductase n=1 Tax=Clostridium zeae TaxID=2759022 RepID=A0ABQ1EEF6_9CLOT|nr:nitroreductase family protein [Clostridium zeae]GFZ33162.1 nitroreductase [Clostridium zeae]